MIELTPAQMRALAELAERTDGVSLHQLAPGDEAGSDDDVYATPHGSSSGFRIDRDGRISEIGETLPSPD